MQFEEVSPMVERAIKAHRPCMLWGPPGVGKSTIIRDLGKKLNLEVRDVRASQLDPSDIRGCPMPDKETKQTEWFLPTWLPREGKGILFLDEINLASQLVQSSLYQLILDRKVGEYKLPDGWDVVAAGNRTEDRSNVFDMSWALCNRFMHIVVEVPSVDCLTKYGEEHGWDSRCLAFLNWKRNLLFQFDPKSKEKPFPTPRTWEFTSQMIKGVEDLEQVKETAICLIGEGAAREFCGFVKLVMSVDVEKVLDGKQEIPKEVGMKYALVSAVTEMYKNQKKEAKKKTLPKTLKLCEKLEPEFKFLLLRQVARADVELFKSSPNLKEFKFVRELEEYLSPR